MIAAVLAIFFLLLLVGMPVAHVVLMSASYGVIAGGEAPPIIAQQLVNGLNSFVNLAVPFFIISGDIAAKGKTSERIIDVINAFLGRLRGGLGIATIFACAFFGAITGSAIATVVAIGAMMMPKLLESSYPKALVLGIITTAGTLGVMIPPSIPMLNMSVALGTSVSDQFLAGFVPGILTALAMSLYVFFVAKKKDIPLQPKISLREKMQVLKKSVWAILFPVIVLGGIYTGITTPTEAAVISLAYVILVELFIYKKVSPWELMGIFAKSSVSAASLMLTIAAARAFVWFMTTAQVPAMLYDAIIANVSNRYVLLIALVFLFFVAGCFTNIQTVVIILGPMLLPVLQHFDINLMHFIIICIMMAQIGFVTPPFGLCLFVTVKVSKSSMVEVTRAALPFILIMFAVTMLLLFVPQISLFLPQWLASLKAA